MTTTKTTKSMPRMTTIEFVKRTVIGEVIADEHGELDIMSAFFDAVEGDSRGDMNPDSVSLSHYEMSDSLGTTKITVQHTPNGNLR